MLDFMRVMVADDSRTTAKRMTGFLQHLGHEVIAHATTGPQAVRLYERLRPELLVLDIVMPGMDGLDVLRAIRGFAPEGRVLIVSSTAGVGGNVQKALSLGVIDVLPKPVSLEALQRALATPAAPAGER